MNIEFGDNLSNSLGANTSTLRTNLFSDLWDNLAGNNLWDDFNLRDSLWDNLENSQLSSLLNSLRYLDG